MKSIGLQFDGVNSKNDDIRVTATAISSPPLDSCPPSFEIGCFCNAFIEKVNADSGVKFKTNSSNGLLVRQEQRHESFFQLKVACRDNVIVDKETRQVDGKSDISTQPNNKTPSLSVKTGSSVTLTGIFDKIDGSQEQELSSSSFEKKATTIKRKREAKLDSKDKGSASSLKRDPRGSPSSSTKKLSSTSSSSDQTKRSPQNKASEAKTTAKTTSSTKTLPCQVSLSLFSAGKTGTNSVTDDKIYDSMENVHIQGKLAIQSDATAVNSKKRQQDSFILRLFLPAFMTFKQMTRPLGSLASDPGVDWTGNDTDFITIRNTISQQQQHESSSSGNSLDFKVGKFCLFCR